MVAIVSAHDLPLHPFITRFIIYEPHSLHFLQVPRALAYFRDKNGKGFHMVHCWQQLKEANKWKLSYASYQEAVRNGTAKVLIDG